MNAKVAQQQKEIEALKGELKEQRSLIEKVSDRFETSQQAQNVVAIRP